MLLQTEQEIFEAELIYNYVIPIGVVIIGLFILFRLIKIVQFFLVMRLRKPLINHIYIKSKKLSSIQLSILRSESSFYRKLTQKQQRYFEHRVATFIKSKEFIGRQGLIVTEQMRVLIAATAVMLTFGFKKYLMSNLNAIIIYPKAYYSKTNDTFHKGEINPQLKAVVFSWEDFVHGYEIGDDNLNLGIHEFGHAIHLNAFSNNDITSILFKKGFYGLTNYLQNNESVRQDLIASKYFRAYAYTNHFEFFAVLLENFIETPKAFKNKYPELYGHMKQMMNFNFTGY